MKRNKIIQLSGLLSICIGGLSICGYIAGKPMLYLWAGQDGMAVNTAILFVLQGICFYLIGTINTKK